MIMTAPTLMHRFFKQKNKAHNLCFAYMQLLLFLVPSEAERRLMPWERCYRGLCATMSGLGIKSENKFKSRQCS